MQDVQIMATAVTRLEKDMINQGVFSTEYAEILPLRNIKPLFLWKAGKNTFFS